MSRTVLWLLAALLPLHGLHADDWVGDYVFPMVRGVPLRDDAGETIAKWEVGRGKVMWENKRWVQVLHSQGRVPNELYVRKDEVARLNDAPGAYGELIRADPKNLWALRQRALVWTRKGLHANAINDLTQLITLEPEAMYFNDRGNARRSTGEYDRALQDYDEALRRDPKEPIYYYNRAAVWEDKWNLSRAIQDYEAAYRLRPTEVDYVRSLAHLLAAAPDAKDRDGKRAVELATQACELTGWIKGTELDTLASAFAEVGDFEKAVQHEKKALEDKQADAASTKSYSERLKLYEQRQPYRRSGR